VIYPHLAAPKGFPPPGPKQAYHYPQEVSEEREENRNTKASPTLALPREGTDEGQTKLPYSFCDSPLPGEG